MIIEMSTTCGSQEEAQRIAKLAVTEFLCACVHISTIESYYRWQNQVHNALEYRLSFKTTQDRYSDLAELIRREHSYELPAVYATPVLSGTNEYLSWIESNTTRKV